MEVLAIIPARGGSKGIKRKNLVDFLGKPLVAHSIEHALACSSITRTIVSTDDDEIANVSRSFGAEVPFMRPKELSDDYVGTISVIRHAIEWFAEKSISFNHVCCIYATAPFVTAADIRNGLEALKESGSDYAFSVTSYPFPIQRAIKIKSDGRIEMFQPEHFSTRSQDLEEAYHDAGQFYWGRSEAWIQELPIFSKHAVPVMLPRHRVQDIDTPEDWIRAEMMFRLLKQD
jgi:N-acylneuraminate cytidylyltransferase